jgi:hypothetical protein
MRTAAGGAHDLWSSALVLVRRMSLRHEQRDNILHRSGPSCSSFNGTTCAGNLPFRLISVR